MTIEEAREGSAWQKYYSDSSLTWFYDRVNNFRRPYMPIALCRNCPADPSSDDGTADIVYASPELANVLREAKASTDDDIESFMESYMNQGSMRRSTSSLASFFTFNSKSQAPRFVVRDSTFVRATGGQADMELQETQSRRRLNR